MRVLGNSVIVCKTYHAITYVSTYTGYNKNTIFRLVNVPTHDKLTLEQKNNLVPCTKCTQSIGSRSDYFNDLYINYYLVGNKIIHTEF